MAALQTKSYASSKSASTSSSSSYAGSGEESNHEDDLSLSLVAQLLDSYDPSHLDRAIAQQAQTSGMVNATNRDMIVLQEEVSSTLRHAKAAFQQGIGEARTVKAELEKTQKRLNYVKQQAADRWPIEYNMAKEAHEARSIDD